MFGGGGNASAMGGASDMSGLGASAAQAAPWIAASMAISKALGGQKTFGGRLFSGGLLNAFWKKDPIHLATGGVVPGGSAASAQDEGDGDTVPAKLTPGELVVPKIEVPDALKAMSGKSYSAQWDSARGGSSVPVPDSSSTASAVQNIGCHTVVNMHGDVYGVDDLDSKIHKAVKSANKEQGWDTMKSRRTATPSSR